jgi:hypothetical protein
MNALDKEQIERHQSLIRTQVKKKRTCIRGCGRTFMSKDAGDRVCCYCADLAPMGIMAEHICNF